MVTRQDMAIGGKIILFGGAESDVPVPAIVPGEERWGLNALLHMKNSGGRFEGVTRWFDIHARDYIAKRKQGDMWSWYQQLSIPVYLTKAYDDLPTSVAYPLEDVQREFDGTRLFCSGLDYMLALAALERPEEVQLYGFRLNHLNYRHQVPSGAWWLKQLRDRNIRVTCLTHSALLGASAVDAYPPKPEKHHLMYGFETTDRARLYRGC